MRFARHFLIACLVFASASVSAAGLFRAYVSSTGNDANDCTVARPCRLLPKALAAVADGGEIWMLDSANYNTSTVNIAKSVTIVAMPGVTGSVVSTNAGDAIDIGGAGIKVTLRNLFVVPLGTSAQGIVFQTGAELDVEDCKVTGMLLHGITANASNARVRIQNTILRSNGGGGFGAGGGVIAVLDYIQSAGNGYGVGAFEGAQVNVSHSLLADNGYGAYSEGDNGVQTQLIVSHSTITGNAVGLKVLASPGLNASLVSDGNTITFAGDTVFQFGGGGGTETIYTRGNNTAGYYNQAVTPGHLLTALNAL